MATRTSLSDQANAIMTLLMWLKQDVNPKQDDQSKANELVNAMIAERHACRVAQAAQPRAAAGQRGEPSRQPLPASNS